MSFIVLGDTIAIKQLLWKVYCVASLLKQKKNRHTHTYILHTVSQKEEDQNHTLDKLLLLLYREDRAVHAVRELYNSKGGRYYSEDGNKDNDDDDDDDSDDNGSGQDCAAIC